MCGGSKGMVKNMIFGCYINVRLLFFNEDFVNFEVVVTYDFSSIAFGCASKINHLFHPCLIDRGGGGWGVSGREEV